MRVLDSKAGEIKEAANKALEDTGSLEELIGLLSDGSRRDRQQAASALALVAKENAQLLEGHSAALVDALNRPEAQTRWEVLDALTELVSVDSRSCDKAIVGAETALFDEDSGPVRLSAMRFLCRLGSTTENRSLKVWPLIDEGIQCYHGDLEFQDMLIAVLDFSSGTIAPDVKKALGDRMRFDATNGKGILKKRASAIMENIS